MHSEDVAFARELLIALFLVTSTVIVLRRARVTIVAALVISGALIALGNHVGLSILDKSSNHLLTTAHVGVALLLLCHGLDASVAKLVMSWRVIALASSVQIGLTIALGALAAPLVIEHCSFEKALFVGIIMATSSPALVFYELRKRGAEHHQEGDLANLMLIAHDLSLLMFALILPSLAPTHQSTASLFGGVALGVAITFGVLVVEWFLIGPVLSWAGNRLDPELFLLLVGVIILCPVVACMTAQLAPSFGVFLGGLLLSRTRFRHYVRGIASQPRDLALPFFFLAVGLLFDWGIFLDHWAKIVFSAIGLIALKFIALTVAGLAVGLTLRPALKLGGYLSHIGETSFVLGLAGLHLQIIGKVDGQVLIAYAVITIALSPLLNALVQHYSERVPDISIFAMRSGLALYSAKKDFTEHVVVVGFGRVGEKLAAHLKGTTGRAYVVIESNGDHARRAEELKHDCILGDARHPHTLRRAAGAKAAVIVVTDATIETATAIAGFLEMMDGECAPMLILRTRDELLAAEFRERMPRALVLHDDDVVEHPLIELLSSTLGRRKSRTPTPSDQSAPPVTV